MNIPYNKKSIWFKKRTGLAAPYGAGPHAIIYYIAVEPGDKDD